MATVLNQENFDSFIAGSTPVLVDMWATWCGPCRMLAPVVEELEEKYAGRLKVGKVDVDENMALAKRFRVVSIPMLLLFCNGELKDTAIGYMEADELGEWLEANL